MWKTISRNVAGQTLASAILWGLGLVVTPLLLNRLGPIQFGMMALATSVVGQLGILDLGLSQALVRRSSELLAIGDRDSLNRTINTILGGFTAIGFCGLLVVVTVGSLLARAFKVPTDEQTLFQSMLYIIAVQAAVSFPCYVWTGVLGGLQKTYVNSAITTGVATLRSAATIAVLLAGHGVIAVLSVQLAATVVSGIVSAACVFRFVPGVRIHPTLLDRQVIADIWKSAGSMFMWGLAGRAQTDIGRFALGLTQGLTAVAIYEVGLRLCAQARVLCNAMVTLMPTAVALHQTGNSNQLPRIYLRCTKGLLLVYGTVTVLTFTLGRTFIVLWLGPRYAEAAIVLDLLIAGTLYQSQTIPIHVIMGAIGNFRVFNLINVGYAVVGAPLAMVLAYRWSDRGAAAAFLLTSIIVDSAGLLVSLRVLEIPLRRVLSSCHAPVVAAVVPVAATAWLFSVGAAATSWTSLIVRSATCMAVAVASAALFALTREERDALAKVVAP